MIQYDKRKIIKIGEKSYAITIPKKWILDLRLDIGATVDLIYDGRVITIKPPTPTPTKHDTSFYYLMLDLCRGQERLAREVTVAYLEGIKSIRIVGDKSRVNDVVRELQSKLVGVVTVEDSLYDRETNIIFLDADLDIRSVVIRIASFIHEILDRILEYINHHGKKHLEKVKALISDVERLYYLGLRLCKGKVASTIGEETLSIVDHMLYLKNVKYLLGTLEKLILVVKEYDSKLSKNAKKYYIYSKKIVIDSLKAYIENDIGLALNTFKIKGDLSNEFRERESILHSIINHLMEIALEISEITVAKCIRDKACRVKYIVPKKQSTQ